MSRVRAPSVLRRLAADRRGLALIEFAYGLPVLLAMGLGGMEIANMSITRMRLSQITLATADNAARVGESNGLALKKIYESDMLDTFEAARIMGDPISLKQRGRIIISSLQQNAATGQWIAWQRCWGDKTGYTPQYGTAGTGKTGTAFAGMGPAGAQVTAPASNAVIFVETSYEYQALVQPFAQGLQYFGLNVNNQVLTYRAAFIVRDPRQLGDSNSTTDVGIYQNTPAVTAASC